MTLNLTALRFGITKKTTNVIKKNRGGIVLPKDTVAVSQLVNKKNFNLNTVAGRDAYHQAVENAKNAIAFDNLNINEESIED